MMVLNFTVIAVQVGEGGGDMKVEENWKG